MSPKQGEGPKVSQVGGRFSLCECPVSHCCGVKSDKDSTHPSDLATRRSAVTFRSYSQGTVCEESRLQQGLRGRAKAKNVSLTGS